MDALEIDQKHGVELDAPQSASGSSSDATELAALAASLAAARTQLDALQAVAVVQSDVDDTAIPSIQVHKNAAQTITHGGTAQALLFDVTDHDSGDIDYDSSTGTFTVNEAGWYHGTFNAQFGAAAGGVRTVIWKLNSTTEISDTTEDPHADGTTAKKVNTHFSRYLAANDQLKAMAFQTNTGVTSLNIAASPEFSGYAKIVKYKNVSTPAPTPATFTPIGSSLIAAGDWYPDSLFRIPIASLTGAGKTVRSDSAAIITSIFSRGTPTATPRVGHISERAGYGGTSQDYSHAVYVGESGDGTKTVRGDTWANPDTEGDVIHVPDYAVPSGGTDYGFSIIDQPSGYEYSFQSAIVSGSEIHCNFCRKTRLDGTGIATDSLTGGVTAAGFSHGLGVVRYDELEAGLIDHALIFGVAGWNGRVYPGDKPTGHTGDIGSGLNAPPMGLHVRLKSSFDPTAHGFPAWKVTILQALKTYGAYCVDNGGSTFDLHIESETPYWSYNNVNGTTIPTVLDELDDHFSHSGNWDIETGVVFSTQLECLNTPVD